jgi:hypothetical protein
MNNGLQIKAAMHLGCPEGRSCDRPQTHKNWLKEDRARFSGIFKWGLMAALPHYVDSATKA